MEERPQVGVGVESGQVEEERQLVEVGSGQAVVERQLVEVESRLVVEERQRVEVGESGPVVVEESRQVVGVNELEKVVSAWEVKRIVLGEVVEERKRVAVERRLVVGGVLVMEGEQAVHRRAQVLVAEL